MLGTIKYIVAELNYPLIDKFIDLWDWSRLINRWNDYKLYNIDFMPTRFRQANCKIPACGMNL